MVDGKKNLHVLRRSHSHSHAAAAGIRRDTVHLIRRRAVTLRRSGVAVAAARRRRSVASCSWVQEIREPLQRRLLNDANTGVVMVWHVSGQRGTDAHDATVHRQVFGRVEVRRLHHRGVRAEWALVLLHGRVRDVMVTVAVSALARRLSAAQV